MQNKPIVDYESSKVEPLSEAERSAFVLLLPAAIGVVAGVLCWMVEFVIRLW